MPGTSDITPRKKKMKKTIARLRTKVSRLQKKNTCKDLSLKTEISEICKKLDNLLPEHTASFIRSQIKVNQLKKREGMRWSLKDKMFALSVFYHSRKAYRILGKLFTLPSKSTLTKLLKSTNIDTGFHESVFEALRNKVQSMSEDDRQCVLIFDEMSIKSGLSYERSHDQIEGLEDLGSIGKTKNMANSAIVFMIRGLSNKWKQCIGYFLSSGPISSKSLHVLVLQAIDKVSNIGLHIKGVICDQGSNNRSFLETHCKVTMDKPFFNHNGHKIFALYDPPHLLKNMRNNLKKHGFVHDEHKIHWWDIVNFYNFDKAGPIRMAPKLTDDHFSLAMFTKMRVNLAAQVLSHSVAAGISTLQRLGHLHHDAVYTAKFVETMDQLFNSFNSSSLKSRKVMGHALSNGSGHIEFWEDVLEYLSKLTIPNGQVQPCMRGWIITIKSLKMLWSDLSENHGFQHLFTRRLNQDCIENLFSIIRGKGGHRFNPDAKEFRAAYRQVVFDQMLQPSEGSNCETDTDSILLSLTSFSLTNEKSSPRFSATAEATEIDKVPIITASQVTLPLQNVQAYMAGYLLRKSDLIKCHLCKSQCMHDAVPQSDLYVFIHEKSFGTGGLHCPKEEFIKLVEIWEQNFKENIDHVIHMQNILGRLFRLSQPTTYNFLSCGETTCKLNLQGMLKLYMKVRLHAALKHANKCMSKKSAGKQNRKLVQLKHL